MQTRNTFFLIVFIAGLFSVTSGMAQMSLSKEQYDDMTKRASALENSVNQLKNEIQRMKKDSAAGVERYEQAQKKNKKDSLNTQKGINDLNAKIRELEQKLANAEAAITDTKPLTNQNADLKLQLAKAEKEIAETGTRRTADSLRIKTLESDLARGKQDADNLEKIKNELNSKNVTINELNTRINDNDRLVQNEKAKTAKLEATVNEDNKFKADILSIYQKNVDTLAGSIDFDNRKTDVMLAELSIIEKYYVGNTVMRELYTKINRDYKSIAEYVIPAKLVLNKPYDEAANAKALADLAKAATNAISSIQRTEIGRLKRLLENYCRVSSQSYLTIIMARAKINADDKKDGKNDLIEMSAIVEDYPFLRGELLWFRTLASTIKDELTAESAIKNTVCK